MFIIDTYKCFIFETRPPVIGEVMLVSRPVLPTCFPAPMFKPDPLSKVPISTFQVGRHMQDI